MGTVSTMHRDRYSTFITPPVVSAGKYRIHVVQGECFYPFRGGLTDAINCEKSVISFIATLLCWCGPVNIAHLIVSVIIFAIQRVSGRWAFTNFGVKLLERIKAKFNAASAISWIAFGVFICATGFGRPIYGILCSVRSAVRSVTFGRTLTPIASARLNFPAFQMSPPDCLDSVTLTFTPPRRAAVAQFTRVTSNKESPETTASKINKSRITRDGFKNNAIFVVGHLANSFLVQNVARAASTLQSLVRPVLILAQVREAM